MTDHSSPNAAEQPATTAPATSSNAPRRYRTILADPPWSHYQVGGHGADQHYPLMTLDRITAMPVADLATDDAHLWLWVTNASLRDGFDVIEAWGFTPRSVLTWIKPRLGLGNYLRNATEHLLLGTRGHAPVQFKAQPSWLFAPLQNHSHKPEEQYAVIERISPGPYLELFARRRPPSRADWSIWGMRSTPTSSSPATQCPPTRRASVRAPKLTSAAVPRSSGGEPRLLRARTSPRRHPAAVPVTPQEESPAAPRRGGTHVHPRPGSEDPRHPAPPGRPRPAGVHRPTPRANDQRRRNRGDPGAHFERQDRPDLLQRADEARREVEREAEQRREAIAHMFGSTAPPTSSSTAPKPRSRRPGGSAPETATPPSDG